MSTPLPAPHTHTLKLQPNMLDSEMCDNSTRIQTDASPVLSAVMFLAGVTGNLTALAILRAHRRECHAKSVFYILVTGLVVTDLLGTCVLSPPVFLEYARDASLLGLGGGSRQICNLFGFTMAFFGLCSTLILTAMALERCLAISHPYFYSRRVHGWYAKGALSLAYVFTSSFCLLPFVGAGQFSQYCPGTWCYVQMEVRGRMGEGEDEAEWRVLAFSLTYSSLMLMLVVVVCLCNGSVIASLCRMQRHGHWQLGRPAAAGVLPGRRRNLGPWFSRGEEEADHLLLLGCMTIIFIICSLPLTICGFLGAMSPGRNHQKHLLALRFSALNPILDPWVFILFRKAIFRHLRQVLHCCQNPAHKPPTYQSTRWAGAPPPPANSLLSVSIRAEAEGDSASVRDQG